MNDDHLKYWLALKSIDGIGNAAFQPLLNCFGSLEAVFSASIATLAAFPDINKKSAEAIVSFNHWDKILNQMDALNKAGVKIITCLDRCYPSRLQHIYDRPAFLYVLGDLHPDDINIAIVGSRQASTYGKYTTERISRELAQEGVTIISGMARGIDSCAHRGALSAKGRTVAVLGCGLDVVYPPENQKLFAAIAETGALISEYPLGTQPLPYHFPSRNRIISGMSHGVLVVEAGEKSGSLITARLAMEQGREVFAIPGAIDSAFSRGANSLIKQGAKLIDSIDDILEEILPQVERLSVKPLSRNQELAQVVISQKTAKDKMGALDSVHQTIVNILAQGKLHADDIITGTGLPAADALSALMTLELKGIVLKHAGEFFSLPE